ncbi:pyocin activator PrtN family protein [Pseudomonas sp. H3_D04]
MNTIFLLMAQYDGQVIVPLDRVCADYFTHLTPEKLKMKVAAGQIDLVIVPIEQSQKSARGVHVNDLADYLDIQRDKAKTEHDRLMGRRPKTLPRQSVSKVEIGNDRPAEPAEQSIQFIRLPEVKRITGMSTTTIYEMANADQFPKQVKLGGRAVAWVKSDVLAWCADKIERAKESDL